MVIKLCNILTSDHIELRTATVKCLTVMFTTEDSSIVNTALDAGILSHLTNILDSAPTQLINYILFSLSNIAAGTQDQTIALLNEELLVHKVL